MQWRIKGLIFFFGALFLFLIFNVYSVQIQKGDYYLAKAKMQEEASGGFEAPRGSIYFLDKNNNSVQAAMNKDYPIVYAVPVEIQASGESIASYAEKLSPITGVSVEELKEKFAKESDKYELIVEKAVSGQTDEIKNLNLKGIYISSHLLRFYPFGDLAAHILGFLDYSNGLAEGKYGLELYFDDSLSGKSGGVEDGKLVSAESGKDLILTIDPNIQTEAEEIVKNLIKQYEAEAGSVIVQEPKTGKILAMAAFPNFDPNNYSKSEISTFLNPTVQSLYEPGSVFKLITMAAGLDSGKITPDTTYTDTGFFTANGKTIKNWDLKANGLQTMTNVIEKSINTGAVYAQRKTGQDIFYNYLVKFGFGEKTQISLPGEVKGNLNNLKTPNGGKDIDFATASYGQGVAVTPIELAGAVSALANGGVLMKPIILSSDEPKVVRRVISADTAKKVAQMMVSAVKVNKIANIPNYSVAGKTGTAFVPDFGGKGYTDKVINTYAGFAPASDPKFVIILRLDKPSGSPLAGQTVVPAFRELAQFILNYYNVAPDEI
ncbi:MAG: penicillin-binding protein 2 [Candidatus Paceibacterota bacterium]